MPDTDNKNSESHATQVKPGDVDPTVHHSDGTIDPVQTALNTMRKDRKIQPNREGLAELTKWLQENDIDSPKSTFSERMNYWASEEWNKINDVWRVLKSTPKSVRSKWKKLIADISILVVFLLIIGLLCVVGHGVFERLSENRQIRPDEDSTTILHFTRSHWFSSNEEVLLEARPDPDDQNIVKWMSKAQDGKWYPFFYFGDE